MNTNRLSMIVWRMIGRMAFSRITVLGRDNLPHSGSILFVATHRNGALDGAPYACAVPNAVPIVSAQLHRSFLGRFLFHGIPVARAKDRDRGIVVDNTQSIEQSIHLLQNEGQLLIMPEGTSTLGCRHLPFQRGAARIAHAAINAGVDLIIVPLGVHYADPTVWQSRVEVLIGEPMFPERGENVTALHRLITKGLETVGASFENNEAQHNAELLASASTYLKSSSYATSLKYFEQFSPESLADMARPIEEITHKRDMCLYQGLPIVQDRTFLLASVQWLALAIMAMGFCLSNAPAMAAGFIASRRLPDEPNVVSFWRMVAGLPVGVIWAVLASILLGEFYGLSGGFVYWVFNFGGLVAWYQFRKLSVALCNGIFHAGARPALLQVYEKLKNQVNHD